MHRFVPKRTFDSTTAGPNRMVVALFPTKGEADNAQHRLITEGIPVSVITLKVLKEVGPVPDSMDAEMTFLKLDPFFWFLGDLKKDYAQYIRNGDTALSVEVATEEAEQSVVSIIRAFQPVRLDEIDPVYCRVAALTRRAGPPITGVDLTLIESMGPAEEGEASMSIQEILDSKALKVETTFAGTNARAAASEMVGYGIAALVVVSQNDDVVGLVSERELVAAFTKHGDALSGLKVGDIMRRDVITIGPEDHVTRAMALMTQHRTRHLPVIQQRRLIGIVSIGDLVKNRLENLEAETRVMRDIYIAGR